MFEYKVEDCGRPVLQERLNTNARDGWRVVTSNPYLEQLIAGSVSRTQVEGWTTIYERQINE